MTCAPQSRGTRDMSLQSLRSPNFILHHPQMVGEGKGGVHTWETTSDPTRHTWDVTHSANRSDPHSNRYTMSPTRSSSSTNFGLLPSSRPPPPPPNHLRHPSPYQPRSYLPPNCSRGAPIETHTDTRTPGSPTHASPPHDKPQHASKTDAQTCTHTLAPNHHPVGLASGAPLSRPGRDRREREDRASKRARERRTDRASERAREKDRESE